MYPILPGSPDSENLPDPQEEDPEEYFDSDDKIVLEKRIPGPYPDQECSDSEELEQNKIPDFSEIPDIEYRQRIPRLNPELDKIFRATVLDDTKIGTITQDENINEQIIINTAAAKIKDLVDKSDICLDHFFSMMKMTFLKLKEYQIIKFCKNKLDYR